MKLINTVEEAYNHDHSDLLRAIEHNGAPLPQEFYLVSEILSDRHDEGEYFWLVYVPEKGLAVLSGGHDYTGWDCQSHLNTSEYFNGLEQLPLYVQEYDNQNRPVRQMLINQADAMKFKEDLHNLLKEE